MLILGDFFINLFPNFTTNSSLFKFKAYPRVLVNLQGRDELKWLRNTLLSSVNAFNVFGSWKAAF